MRQYLNLITFALLCIGISGPAAAQLRLSTDGELERQIVASGMIHTPLPVDRSRSFEAAGARLQIIDRQVISEGKVSCFATGLGRIAPSEGGFELRIPTVTDSRAVGSPDDPDYAVYGHGGVIIKPSYTGDWSKWDRIAFRIFPDSPGARVVNLNLSFGGVSHLVNLRNGEWNDCFLDIAGVERNSVESLSLGCSVKGRDRTTGAEYVFRVGRIELQKVAGLDPESGWTPAPEKIIYSTSGYRAEGPKTAIVTVARASKFSLVDSRGKTVFRGPIQSVETTIGSFQTADFSQFSRSGNFSLRVGELQTPPFEVGPDVWTNSLWRLTSFIFAQRCGHPVPAVHGDCHGDLFAEHNGRRISYSGGWHDAGDLSQQTLQTGDVTFSLLEAYKATKRRNPALAARLHEEALWGLEMVLRSRFGDGYRASSMGMLIWLDGVVGTRDDIGSVRVQNLALDNFLYAAYEAFAAMTVENDPALRQHLQRIAAEDFEFAMKRHKEVGYGEFLHFYEHSYNTSESQYMATISWAASMLFRLTGEPRYAQIAAESIRYTIDCQRVEPLGDGTRGFFYRDTRRLSIVHYVHQSREQVYMQALAMLCETQPDHPDRDRWASAIRLHGDYLKGLMRFTAPYGMIPSGVYHVGEPRDKQGFEHLHLWPPDNAEELYWLQICAGQQIDSEHFVRRFPVWFSIFNGNTAVHLSMGKAAAICGKFLNDSELSNIGLEQMYWTAGKNPFGQSLIYGEGWNYPSLDNFSSGELTGAIPVGIRSFENSDEPYWPRVVNACYKEVWLTSAGKWMSLAAEY